MALHLVHGPPNSGRAGLIRERFTASLERNPVLIVPTLDDVFAFERELSDQGAVLGGAVMTFGGLFRAVLAACGTPPGLELTPAQRLRAVAIAIREQHGRLGPLRHSAARPGFALAFARLLDELQESGLSPAEMEAATGTLEDSAYLDDLARLFVAYGQVRDRIGLVDSHLIARQAIAGLDREGEAWEGRPVFLYGLDDLTANQLALVRSLAGRAEVTVSIPHEEGNPVLEARSSLLRELREAGVATETPTEPNPANTEDPLLFHLERQFGATSPERRRPGPGLTILRSAGERGEAEAIALEAAKLLAAGTDPAQIAIALRDPRRRGPAIASVLESCGIAIALEAEMPVTATSIGGTLVALLEAEFGAGRASDLLRFLRGPSGISPRQVDWFERRIRRSRAQSAAAALELWEERYEKPPNDMLRLRAAASTSAAELAKEVGRLAATMASRPMRGNGDGPPPGPGDGLELRAASAISTALADLARIADLVPEPEELAATIAAIEFRIWSGPVEGRVRIASPYRLRAARFDHVIVPSLQDGEFPQREGGGDPFLADSQRASLGLEPRRDTEAEERYLFHACLALARRRLYLSYRDSDENGVAEPPSPFLDDVRRLLDPPPSPGEPDPLEGSLLRGRTLVEVVHRVAEAPSETELARAIAVHGPAVDATPLLDAAGVEGPAADAVAARLEAACLAEAATRAPGPLSNPAAIEALAAVSAHGGTTLELFDSCSYRWFVGHELDPKRLDPDPEPIVQGGLMHEALDRLYKEAPGGQALPLSASLGAWIDRGDQLVVEIAAERALGKHPAERAMVRRVRGLLARFLAEEAERGDCGFEPWRMEAKFGDEEGTERPALELDGWKLHGAIDRIDRSPGGGALVIDYKLASKVTPRQKLEEEAKLQLQLYLVAVAELWSARPVGGLYHPLRQTSERRARGVVLDEVAEDLAPYGLASTDVADREEFEEVLADARRRAAEIVARMRRGDIRRDPGPRAGLSGHDVCPPFCDFAPICRRDRAPVEADEEESEE